MILHELTVSAWRSILEEVTVGPFTEGLTVIHAPNGTGKSAMFEALRRGLMDNHAVTGQDVDAIRPWGRSLSPTVTVVFSHGGRSYRVEKRFLDGAYSRLYRKEDGVFRPLAENRTADEQVRALFAGNAPGRGLSRSENWGLAQALWAPQGKLELTELTGDLVADIRSALGAQLADASGGALEKRIKELYDQYYTSKGKFVTGVRAPELVRLRGKLTDVQDGFRVVKEQLLKYEETSREVEDLRAIRAQARCNAEEYQKEIAQTRQRAEAYRALNAERERRSEAVKGAEARWARLRQQIDLIAGSEEALARARGELAELLDAAPSKRREVEALEGRLETARAALEDAQQGRADADAAEHAAEAARRYTASLERAATLDGRLARIESATRQHESARDARRRVVAPDRETLTAIRKETRERDDARTRIDASSIALEIVPAAAGSVQVIAGEDPGVRPLTPGRPVRVKGSPEIVVELPGVARLRASGPSGDAEQHRGAYQDAVDRIAELCRPFGTDDVSALEALNERAREADSDVVRAETELQTLLGEDVVDQLKQERALVEAALAGVRREYPDWAEAPPSPDLLGDRASGVRRDLEERVAAAEGERERAQAALAIAREQEQVLRARLVDAERRVDREQEQLAALTQDGRGRPQREEELQGLALAWEAARAGLEEVELKLGSLGDDPSAELERLEGLLAAADQAAREARDKEMAAEGRLETLAARGPYSAYVSAEEAVAQLEARIRREQLRADAVRLLYTTWDACRKEAVAAVSRPVEQAATRMLQRIAGRRLGGVRLSDSFAPNGVQPEAAEAAVALDNLSGGEKEQVYLATRLALAEVLAREERQLVVLDDVLTATDTGRLARIMTLLEEAAQRVQVLVLTCHPERYRALPGAAFFDLAALIGA